MKLPRSAAVAVLALAAGVSCAGAAPAPDLAAPSTCQGKAVTIVATAGVTQGTEGDDVVAMVPHEWGGFDALGGNDTMCLAPNGALPGLEQEIAYVNGGDGDDVVVNPSPPFGSEAAQVNLGYGSDTFQGANDYDVVVYAEERRYAEEDGDKSEPETFDDELVGQQRDVITGATEVYSSAPTDGPNADRITLSAPDAKVFLDGPLGPDGLLEVSPLGQNATLELSPDRLGADPAGDLLIDNQSRTVSAGGPPLISWSGVFSVFEVGRSSTHPSSSKQTVSFTGTDAAERVEIYDGLPGDVAMHGGIDDLRVVSVPRSADGGPSYDRISLSARCRGALDVRIGRFARCDEQTGSFEGFEDVDVRSLLNGSTTTLVGTSHSEHLSALGHSVVVRAGAGRDTIMVNSTASPVRVSAGAGHDRVVVSLAYARALNRDDVVVLGQGGNDRLTLRFRGFMARQTHRIVRGGRGNDFLRGGADKGPDRLIGGPGRDRADGRAGPADFCSAEVTRRCERP